MLEAEDSSQPVRPRAGILVAKCRAGPRSFAIAALKLLVMITLGKPVSFLHHPGQVFI